MSAMTNYLERMLLNTMRQITATAPARVYIALFLSDPTESGAAGTEVSYTGYARQQVTFAEPSQEGNSVQMRNAAEVVFPTPAGASGTVTHAAFMDAQTGGNMLAYNALVNPIILTAETSPRFAEGLIVFTLGSNYMVPDFKIKIMNFFRGTTINGFAPYLALYNGDPTAGGTELAGTGYARLPLEFDAPEEQVSGQMQTVNTNSAESESAAVSWGIWAYGVIMDSSSSGNRVWYRQNRGSYNMENNARAYLQPGDVTLALN